VELPTVKIAQLLERRVADDLPDAAAKCDARHSQSLGPPGLLNLGRTVALHGNQHSTQRDLDLCKQANAIARLRRPLSNA
jgi:hypothetical protein